nr:Fe3+ hydroxamate ABC transporter substrate-binding protein [Parageobacillus thermantarcticus]
MFSVSSTCSVCGKPIEKNEPIYVRMRYPSYRGMVEITAFLKQEGTIICEGCFSQKNDHKK